MGILEVKGVNKRFGGLKALDDVNINVEEGTVHAIIGPNGAGKSTLLNCLIGRLDPDTGTVQFNGQSLLNQKPHKINQMGVSRVFQTPEIFAELNLLDNVLIPALASRDGAFTLNAWSRLETDKALREEGMARLESVNLADAAHRRAAELSRGDKRRLELAMCLIQQPKAVAA